MWIIFAFGSTLLAGLTAILAKCGVKQTDSTVATAIRTVIVLIFSWFMAALTNAWPDSDGIRARTLLFLILSGFSTGASWLCYFKALQVGDINKVVPIDKFSTILTILLAFVLLHEPISPEKIAGIICITIGTWLMIEKKETYSPQNGNGENENRKNRIWMLYALGSAIFASLTAILGKIGITDIQSNLGTAIRTSVVLVMAWGMVLITGKQRMLKQIPQKELCFICLSGVATGGSWLCYYRALQDGPASVVVPIDKLSILVTVAFSCVVLHEKLTTRSGIGLGLIVAGTLAMLVEIFLS